MKKEAREDEERNCQNESSLLQHLAGVRPAEQRGRERDLSENRGGRSSKITSSSNLVLHLFRVSILLDFHCVAAAAAAETDGRCFSSAAQDVLHEQRRPEHGCVGLQPAAMAESAQTQLHTVQFSQSFQTNK